MRQGNKYRFVSCGSYNITSVTTWNVTYGCYEISKICPAATTNARKMWYLKGGKGGGGSTGKHWEALGPGMGLGLLGLLTMGGQEGHDDGRQLSLSATDDSTDDTGGGATDVSSPSL
jgi:hypothetical protein